ncbi:hypothetical protein HQ520_17855 [bacterium]|nr:hypothetical protein [bacterium]
MTLINGADQIRNPWKIQGAGQIILGLHAPHTKVLDSCLILLDRRPDLPQQERQDIQLRYGALLLDCKGPAHIEILRSEVHSPASCIQIQDYTPGNAEEDASSPSTDYVRIADCKLRGYFEGYYKIPSESKAWGLMGSRHSAVVNHNAKNLIVERCDIGGADRPNRKMINRTLLNFNTSIRHVYVAHNNSHDMGIRSPEEGYHVNQGESILFHYKYPSGGFFDVKDATPQSVSVKPDDERYAGEMKKSEWTVDRAGSRVLPQIGESDHWIVFVASGRGVGQYRVVTGVERAPNRAEFQLNKPWRVIPDSTSQMVLLVV